LVETAKTLSNASSYPRASNAPNSLVDKDNHVIGIISQADLALKDDAGRVHKMVAEISKTTRPSFIAA